MEVLYYSQHLCKPIIQKSLQPNMEAAHRYDYMVSMGAFCSGSRMQRTFYQAEY
jgi:hypothetical protein